MLKIFLVFILYIQFLYADILNYTNDKDLTIDDSVKLALLNNRNLSAANEDLSTIKYKTDEALAYRYPQLDLAANYFHYNAEDFYIVGNKTDSFLLDKYNQDANILRFNFSQVLYSGRRTINTKKNSEISLKKARSDFELIKNNIVYNVKFLFMQYMFNKKKMVFLIDNRSYISNSPNDYVFNMSLEIDNAKLNLEQIKIKLFNVIGIEQDSLVELQGDFLKENELDQDIKTYIIKALYLRPELISSEALEELGSLEVNISLSEKTPIISFNSGYQYSSNMFSLDKNSWKNNWYFGFNVNLPIFDGGTWIARNNQKKNNLRKLRLKKSEIEENIKLDVQKSYLEYKISKNNLSYASNTLKRFENNNNIEKIYQNFKNNNFQKKEIDIFTEYIRLTLAFYDAIFNYNKSILNFHLSVGDIS